MLTKCKDFFQQLKQRLVIRVDRIRYFLWRNARQIFCWLLFALTPFLCVLEVEILSQSNPFTNLALWQWVMNLVWYALLLFLGWVITGRRKGAVAFDVGVSFVLGLVNHYVLRFRGRALFPIDLLGWKTAANVAGGYDYTPDNYIWGALGLVAVIVFTFLFLPRDRRRFFGRRWVHFVNLGIGVGFGVYIVCFFFTSMLPTLGVYSQQWKTQGNGFLLNFTVSARYMRVEQPEGYTEEGAQALIASLEDRSLASDTGADGDAVTNFIVIMDESFTDLTAFENLTLTEDPTPFYHSLTENTIKGNMVSPVTGGGTAAVEFEALTGNTMAFLPAGTVAYQMYLTDNTPSLAQIAGVLGVRSSAYHPYESSGWNRITAYSRLGFDSQYYLDTTVDGDAISTEYGDDELVREFVSDAADFERVFALTDAAKAEGENCFVFNVTMQNHSGYNKTWKNLTRSSQLSGDYDGQDYDGTVEQYLALATATDEALEQLIAHYSAVEEKTVILFFGDHQPPLSNELYEDIYGKDLDDRTDEELLEQYVTPFFIWTNYDIEEQQDVTIGANFMGVLASRLAGYPQTGYMKYLAEVNETFASVTRTGYVMADGRVLGTDAVLTQEEQQLLDQYEWLQYYNLFGSGNKDFFFVSAE